MKKFVFLTVVIAMLLVFSCSAQEQQKVNAEDVAEYISFLEPNAEVNLVVTGELTNDLFKIICNVIQLKSWDEIRVGLDLSQTTGLTSIGKFAFGNAGFGKCTSLTSITIPDSVTSISDYAFISCTSLTSITIPDSVTEIGDSAFIGCTSLTSIIIPDSVTEIGYNAFKGCKNLTSITIPDSVTYIGNWVFNDCPNIEKINVASGNKVYDSRNNCNAIIQTVDDEDLVVTANTLIVGCKNTVIPDSVTEIGDYAFEGCTSLTSITIPNSVTRIGNSAFEDCTNLTSITIPNSVIYIETGAFSGCTSLTSITIPNSVTCIEAGAFYGCTNLSEDFKAELEERFDYTNF